MKTLYSKTAAALFVMSGLLSQNVSAQCAVTTGPTNNCSYGDAIDNFTIGTQSVTTNAGCSSGSGYSAYPTPVFNFDLDSTYTLTADVGGNTYNQGLAIWIDLNNDGVYDATEQVYASATEALSHTGSITIASTFPSVVTGTPLPMRVMCVYNQVIPAANACTSSQNTYGETEDYAVILTAVTPPSNIEATAVFEPFDNDCGVVSDSVKVTVTNLTATDEVNVPVELNLTGLVTGTYYDTIPSLLGNTSQDINMAVINTQAGGVLDAELIVDFSDDDPTDDTLTVSINISDATDLVLTGDSIVCEGDSLTLTVSNTSGTETYTWYVDGTMATTGATFNTGALSADAEISVESSNACRASDSTSIQVTPLPVASFTSSVNVGTVDFTGTVANQDSVSWDFGDGNAGSGITTSNTYTANGSYIVCLTAYSGCGSVDFCDTVVVATIGVDELFAGGNVDVYPNPTQDIVTVQLEGVEGFKGSWVLYDMDGKLLQSDKMEVTTSTTELSISLGKYAAGAYILEITSESGDVYRKELLRN